MSKAGQFLPQAYLKGSIVPFDQANISIATHALHYGTAAFAGMRVEPDSKHSGNVTLFRPELHIQRLSNSAKLLGHDLSPAAIKTAITTFIAANPGDEPYYLRPLVYASDLGIAPRLHDIEFDLLMYGVHMGEYLSSEGATCSFSSWMRGEDRTLPLRAKISGSYVTSALAKTEAVSRGFDEAILLNTAGKVAEGSAMNIFMVKNGELVTPTLADDILEGITRRSILELARELGMSAVERSIDKSELLLADEVFLSGTAARIAPVTKIEQYNLPPEHPIANKLMTALGAILNQEDSKHADWISSLPAAQK